AHWSHPAAWPKWSVQWPVVETARKRSGSDWLSRVTSSCAERSPVCAEARAARSVSICARTPRGSVSRPANSTTTMKTVRRTAKNRSVERLMDNPSGASTPVDGDIARIDGGGQRDGEGVAFRFPDSEQSLATLFVEFPIVEAGDVGRVAAANLRLAAQAVQEGFAVEREEVGGILALIHLSEVVFRNAQVFDGQLARAGLDGGFDIVAGAHAQGHAPLGVPAAQLEPTAGAGFVPRAAVGGE